MRDLDPEQLQASPAQGRDGPASLWTVTAIALVITVAAPLGALALIPRPPAQTSHNAEAPPARLPIMAAGLLPAPMPTPQEAGPSASVPVPPEATTPRPSPRAADLPAASASIGELPPADAGEEPWSEATARAARLDASQAEFRPTAASAPAIRVHIDERAVTSLASAALAFAISDSRPFSARRVEEVIARVRDQANRSAIEAGVARRLQRGAESMDRGARTMAEEARKLRSFDYRERQIAKATERGDVLTHERLLEAIPELEKGSRELVEGAAEMRREAHRMREQPHPLAS